MKNSRTEGEVMIEQPKVLDKWDDFAKYLTLKDE